MRHDTNIKYKKATDISEVVIASLLDAWIPSSDILFSREEALSIIKKLIFADRSEFAMQNIRVLTSGGDIMGVTLALELSDIQAARQTNVFTILSGIDNKNEFMERLSRYNQCFQSLPEERGIYLSKFSVTKRFRGHGVGAILMEHFLGCYASEQPVFLEVHKSNSKAIALYEQYGFKKLTDLEETEYFLMKRKPQVR